MSFPNKNSEDHSGVYTLYQWPSSEYTDSIYVRCTKIQRVLGYLGVPYRVAEISLPLGGNDKELSNKINPLMRKIPILQVSHKYIEETSSIVAFLIQETGKQNFRYKQKKGKPSPAFFLNHWVEQWLVWMVIYGRWHVEANYQRFIKTVGKIDQRLLLKSGLSYTRKRACDILAKTEVGQMSFRQYLNELEQGCIKLESVLEHSPFLTGSEMSETDLGLFMCMQAFLDPSLAEESHIVTQYPSLCRWAKLVDQETSTPHTKPVKILYGEAEAQNQDESDSDDASSESSGSEGNNPEENPMESAEAGNDISGFADALEA